MTRAVFIDRRQFMQMLQIVKGLRVTDAPDVNLLLFANYSEIPFQSEFVNEERALFPIIFFLRKKRSSVVGSI